MKFVPILQDLEIRQHAEQSQTHWGRGATLIERESLLKKRLLECGPDFFHMSGLVDEGGNLLSSLKRYYFEVSSHRCVGLGAIFTEERSRQKGFADGLIRSVLKESQEKYGCRYALLFSDIGTSYYERFGFQAAPALDWKILAQQLPDCGPLKVRKAEAQDLSRLLEWHGKYSAQFPLRCDRSKASWELFRSLNKVEQDLVLSRDGIDLGFLSLSFTPEATYLWIEEWVAPPEEENAVWAAIRVFCEQANLKEARGWLTPNFLRLNGAEKYPRQNQVPMLLDLLHPGSLTEKDLRQAYFAGPDHF